MSLYHSMHRLSIPLVGIPSMLAWMFVVLSSPIPAHASADMGFVYVVKSDPSTPSTVFAAAQRGLFKSTDAGETWTVTSLTQGTVALAIAPATLTTPTTVYAGNSSGLFKSVDGGTNWSTTGVSSVCSVEIEPATPTTPTTVYASTCSQIIKSMDDGGSWSSVAPPGSISSVAIAGGPPIVLYAVDGVQVFSSTDGGLTWSAGSNPDPDYLPAFGLYGFYLAVDPVKSTTAYVSYWGWSCNNDGCFTSGAISKSIDGGITWFSVDRLVYYGSWVSPQVVVSPVAINPSESGIVYAAWNVYCGQFDPYCLEEHWISKGSEGGVTRVSDLSAGALWFDALTHVLYASTDSGVLTSTDGGVTWSAAGPPPPPTDPPPPPPAPADTTPPDTLITSASDGTAVLANDAVTLFTALTLSFAGTDDVGLSRFECQLDGVGFTACASPLVYNALTLGRHTVEVRAVDTSGNVDGTPARYTWTVDAPPDTTIGGAVDGRGRSLASGGRTPSDKVTFRFAGTDNDAVRGFECRLDAGNFTSCTSPVTYTGLTRGAHTFGVRAVDNNAFRDPSPATFTWTR